MRIIRWVVGLGFFLLLCPNLHAGGPSDQRVLSLQEVVRLALEHHPGLQAARYAAQSASWGVKRAYFEFLPKIAVDFNYSRLDAPTVRRANIFTDIGRELVRQFAPDADPNDIRPVAWRNAFGTSISVQQPLYNGGALRAQVQLAQAGDVGAGSKLREKRQQVVLEAMQAYFDLVKATELYALARQSVEATRERLASIRRMYEVGMQDRPEVLRWEVELASAEGRLVQARSGFELAHSRLAQLIGMPVDSTWRFERPEVNEGQPLEPLETYLAKARQNNPSLQAFSANLASGRAQVKLARSNFLPHINLMYNYQWETNNTIELDSFRSWTFGVGVHIPLFNSFADYSRLQESRLQLRQAEAAQQELEQAIEMQVRQAYYQVQAAQQRIEWARRAQNLAQQNLRVVRDMFELGMATNHDLLEAKVGAERAETDLIQAQFDFLIAKANLEAAAGILSAE